MTGHDIKLDMDHIKHKVKPPNAVLNCSELMSYFRAN